MSSSKRHDPETNGSMMATGFDPQHKAYFPFQIRMKVSGDFYRVLVHMLQGLTIDRYFAQNQYGIGDLRSRISEIRTIIGKEHISSVMKKHVRKDGQTSNISDYRMTGDAISYFWKNIDTDKFFKRDMVSGMMRTGAPLKEQSTPCTGA